VWTQWRTKQGDLATKDMEKVEGLNVFSGALLAWSVLGSPVPSSGVWGHRALPMLQETELETSEDNGALSSPWECMGFICRGQHHCKAALLLCQEVPND